MELLWFSTNLSRDVRLKGEGKVLQTAQLWILPVQVLFPSQAGGQGRSHCLERGQGPGQASPASQRPCAAPCPAAPGFPCMGRNLLLGL